MTKKYYNFLQFMVMLLSVTLFNGCSFINNLLENPEILTNNQSQALAEEITNENTEHTTEYITQSIMLEIGEDNSIGDNYSITRAMAAKMLSLVHYTPTDIKTIDKVITFKDVDENSWYFPYINAVYQSNLMLGDGELFNPDKALTFNESKLLLDRLFPENNLNLNVNAENMDSPISYALWCQLYNKTLESADSSNNFGIYEKDIVILATNGNNSQLVEYFMITDKGPMYYSGLELDNFLNKSVKIQYKDNEIVSINSFINHEPTIKNAYVVSNNSNNIIIFTGGAERSFLFESTEDLTGIIVDIKIHDNSILELSKNTDIITGSIKLTNSNEIEISVDNNSIKYEVDENTKVYSITNGKPRWFSISDLIVGSDVTDFVISDGKIASAIIKEAITTENIRVVLNTSNYAGLLHESVQVTSDENFIVDTGDEQILINKGEFFTVSSDKNADLLGKNRLLIHTENSGGKIKVLTIDRAWTNNESPMYRGVIEISKNLVDENIDGYYVVNELSFDEYLYAVVPSEMPSSYGIEAARVQAITARSYAFNQFFENKYHEYGANIDDSVLCQVYNNIPENATSIEGVTSTAGKCLTYEGEVVSANFFSTSSGVTANKGEVWVGENGEFPSATVPYLQSVKQFESDIYLDLSNEETALSFFKDLTIESYDSSYSWFRWNVEMSVSEIENSINQNLKTRYLANPSLITTLQADGTYKSIPIETIGTLQNIEVYERSESGSIMRMKIVGSEATIIVSTEYNIRMLIRPYQYESGSSPIELNMKNGTKMQNYSLMPSSFYAMEYERNSNDDIINVKFYGGGNGHGVGMSQNGAKGMVDKGFLADEILLHYYPNCQISKLDF